MLTTVWNSSGLVVLVNSPPVRPSHRPNRFPNDALANVNHSQFGFLVCAILRKTHVCIRLSGGGCLQGTLATVKKLPCNKATRQVTRCQKNKCSKSPGSGQVFDPAMAHTSRSLWIEASVSRNKAPSLVRALLYRRNGFAW